MPHISNPNLRTFANVDDLTLFQVEDHLREEVLSEALRDFAWSAKRNLPAMIALVCDGPGILLESDDLDKAMNSLVGWSLHVHWNGWTLDNISVRVKNARGKVVPLPAF